MRIDILCTDGSPIGVTLDSLYGYDKKRIGVGGSEYALLTMAEEWGKTGHEVILYNSPNHPVKCSFEQRPTSAFIPGEKRDVVIIFRSPNPKGITAEGLKVWWSCDQYTIGDFATFSKCVDKIVCISPFHKNYFASRYNINNAMYIDLPVRLSDIEIIETERIENKFIFTSVPDRGLHNLWAMWPRIKDAIPDATLTITSDYRLWGAGRNNDIHRQKWLAHADGSVKYKGAVPRSELIFEQLSSDIMLYPCSYEELFCIAVAEAECCGVYPITTGIGALGTTNEGSIVAGNPGQDNTRWAMIDLAIDLLRNRDGLEKRRSVVMKNAKERFDPKTIMKTWDEKVFT